MFSSDFFRRFFFGSPGSFPFYDKGHIGPQAWWLLLVGVLFRFPSMPFGCWTKNRGCKTPPNHPFVHRVFHKINHPFWCTTIFWFNNHLGNQKVIWKKLEMREEIGNFVPLVAGFGFLKEEPTELSAIKDLLGQIRMYSKMNSLHLKHWGWKTILSLLACEFPVF